MDLTMPPVDPQQEEEHAAWLAAIVASADDAIISKTLEGVITSWNQGAFRMFGYSEPEVIGRPITLIIPPERLFEEVEILGRLKRGESVHHFETERVAKDGRRIPISLSVSPVVARDGRIVGASKVARDISERKRLEQEREELRGREQAALAQAQLANQAKDEFLAMLAHELRNPVGVIVSALAVLEQHESPHPQHQRARTLIGRQAHHLSRLLDDLLDVARIGGGLIELEHVAVDLRAALEQAVEAERHRIDRKRQHMLVSLGDEPIIVAGDPIRLQQIFGNLLNNACKYTPMGGSIWITLAVEDDVAVATIRDDGQGIPPEKLNSIFDLFVQAHPTLARTDGGLGIGLSLVKRLVQMHGGDVHASTGGPGRGATFTVRLPCAPMAAVPSGPVAASAPASPQRILVIEDNGDAREMLATLLRLVGHEVVEAATGKEGIELALRHAPTTVILDIGLPDVDGYEVGRRLRQRLGGGVRLVALSGYGQVQDRTRSTKAGFDAHLVKPVDPATLGKVIQGPG
jgi:PAS domain S-box-containing protein